MSAADEILKKIVELGTVFGAKRIILFGSALQDIENARDIDIACDGIEGWHLYEFGAKLENEFCRPFDTVSLTPVSPFTQQIEAYGRVLL
ncbi:MAG: nucleotidyltransferase domain-containing protein [Ignavibacteriales bacterium]|nr:nucleotidyltransferase domain-containing protein [Ignavibacteriales bacterium]